MKSCPQMSNAILWLLIKNKTIWYVLRTVSFLWTKYWRYNTKVVPSTGKVMATAKEYYSLTIWKRVKLLFIIIELHHNQVVGQISTICPQIFIFYSKNAPVSSLHVWSRSWWIFRCNLFDILLLSKIILLGVLHAYFVGLDQSGYSKRINKRE